MTHAPSAPPAAQPLPRGDASSWCRSAGLSACDLDTLAGTFEAAERLEPDAPAERRIAVALEMNAIIRRQNRRADPMPKGCPQELGVMLRAVEVLHGRAHPAGLRLRLALAACEAARPPIAP